MPSRTWVLKPVFSTVRLYAPTGKANKTNAPFSPAVTVRVRPVPVFRMVTFAFGTAPPVGSTTTPPRLAKLYWAINDWHSKNAKAGNTNCVRNLTGFSVEKLVCRMSWPSSVRSSDRLRGAGGYQLGAPRCLVRRDITLFSRACQEKTENRKNRKHGVVSVGLGDDL